MTPDTLATLHARAFPGPPRPWSAAEYADLLSDPRTTIIGDANAVLVLRCAGPEAEVLTLFTAPEGRRQGLARALLAQAEASALADGVEEIFLEVADTNQAARALYAAAGYLPRGIRKDYYETPAGPRIHAHVLSKRLRPAASASANPH